MTKKSNWIIIGRHPVMDAIDSGQSLDKVLIDRLSSFQEIVEKCKKADIPLQKVPKEKLDKLGTNHQGVAAFRSQVDYLSLEDLVPHLFDQGKTPILVILDRITDVGNFGAIARSAVALGADAIIFPFRETAQLNADAVKRSAGALLNIELCRVRDLLSAVRFLRDSGIRVIAADEKGSVLLSTLDLTQPIAIILGSEGEGVAPELIRHADDVVNIAQTGDIDSLNVSVAAGIILYEIRRQRSNIEH